MKMPHTRSRQKISYAFLFSIVLHACFLLFSVRQMKKTNPPITKMSRPHSKMNSIRLEEIKIISRKELKEIKDGQKKQIVANETSGKNERPDKSRFLGEKNQVFERQTMAHANGSFKEAGKGVKEGQENIVAENNQRRPTPSGPKHVRPMKKPLTLSDLGSFKMADLEKMDKKDEETLEEMTKELERDNKKSGAALGVEKGKANQAGLAQNNDFVEDVPLGDMTNLNTTEYKYYGFYHRIRQKLEQHWGSSIKAKAKNLYRAGKRMPASESLITSVTVVLNDLGEIIDMQIEGTSGVRELDQAAIDSFNKAGPFPNPPKGLLVDGRATIQWGFVIKS